MFCEKCGKEIVDGSKFCSNCGNRTSLGKTEVSGHVSKTDSEMQEHILARAEISWGPMISAIIGCVLLIAIYFLVEEWLLKPKLYDIGAGIIDNDYEYISYSEQQRRIQEFVSTFLNIPRVLLLGSEAFSIVLNFLVRKRQFLYVTNKRIVGNSGHIFGKRSLDLPLSQVKELKIDKAFSLIPHTSIYVNKIYDFQIKEGQEFKLIVERLVKEACANKKANPSSPLQKNPSVQHSGTANRISANVWICGKCGAQNDISDSFCNDCGNYK